MIEMNPAYLAGLFDGEGSIGIYRYFGGKYALRTQFTQNKNKHSTKLFNALMKEFGGNLGLHRTLSGRLAFNWQLSSRNAAMFLGVIFPHLLFKREQAALAISWMKSKPLPSRNKKTGHYNPYPWSRQDATAVKKMKRIKEELKGTK